MTTETVGNTECSTPIFTCITSPLRLGLREVYWNSFKRSNPDHAVSFGKLRGFKHTEAINQTGKAYLLDSESHNRQLAQALAHPVRIRILTRMNAPRRRLSPRDYCNETGELLSTVSYHFRCLNDAGLITLAEEKPVRGSLQHFYEPVDRAMAWTREYEALAPVVRQNFAATSLRAAVEAVGASVDAGTFDARADSHLSWDSMRVDNLGWIKLTELLNRTLKEAIAIGEECELRVAPGDGFLASFLLSCFESPPPPSSEGETRSH